MSQWAVGTGVRAWQRSETPDSRNDGIVTADEVGLLKLEGTWLVVLSACDTGIGEIKAGERAQEMSYSKWRSRHFNDEYRCR